MLRSMPERLFLEWWAFYEQELFGEQRADLRSGIVASTIANIHRGKQSKPFNPVDFMPYVPKQPITGSQIAKAIGSFMQKYKKPKKQAQNAS